MAKTPNPTVRPQEPRDPKPTPKPPRQPSAASGLERLEPPANQQQGASSSVMDISPEDFSDIADEFGVGTAKPGTTINKEQIEIDGIQYYLYTDPYGNSSVQTQNGQGDYFGMILPYYKKGKLTRISISDAIAQILRTKNPEQLKNTLFKSGLITQDDLAKNINDSGIRDGLIRGLNALATNNYSLIKQNKPNEVQGLSKFEKFVQTYEPGMGYKNMLRTKQQAYNSLKETAFKNGVTLPDNFLENNSSSIANGNTDITEVENRIRSLAKSLYPSFAEGLQNGFDLDTLAQDYIRTTQNILELPYDKAMNKVRTALSSGVNNLADYTKSMYQDPEWMKTQNAAQAFQNVYSVLKEGFRV